MSTEQDKTSLNNQVYPYNWNLNLVDNTLTIVATHVEECLIYELTIKECLKSSINYDDVTPAETNTNQPILIDPEDLFIIFQQYFNKTLDSKIKITFPTNVNEDSNILTIVIECFTSFGKLRNDVKYLQLVKKFVTKEDILTHKLEIAKHKIEDRFEEIEKVNETINEDVGDLERRMNDIYYKYNLLVNRFNDLDEKYSKLSRVVNTNYLEFVTINNNVNTKITESTSQITNNALNEVLHHD